MRLYGSKVLKQQCPKGRRRWRLGTEMAYSEWFSRGRMLS